MRECAIALATSCARPHGFVHHRGRWKSLVTREYSQYSARLSASRIMTDALGSGNTMSVLVEGVARLTPLGLSAFLSWRETALCP